MPEDSNREHETRKQTDRDGQSNPSSEGLVVPENVPSYPGSLLGDAKLDGRGNQPVRIAMMRQAQQNFGNRAVQRFLQRGKIQDPPSSETENASESGSVQREPETNAAPTEDYLVPFDRFPFSAPGERIIFNAVYSHATPTDFKLVFTAVGGTFDSASGSKTKTIAGLVSGNLNFFIDEHWNGKTPVMVRIRVINIPKNKVSVNKLWIFSKKFSFPTEMTQKETEDERPLPSVYEYKIGPKPPGKKGKGPFYRHQTILERFERRTGNIHVADLKPDYATTNNLTTDPAITDHFFGTSSNNGTFTVDKNDKIFDQHGGGMPDLATFTPALTTMKEVTVDLPQIYEAKPGVALGRYTIRRILKTDGTKRLRKFKT